jgi:hypothetical protein
VLEHLKASVAASSTKDAVHSRVFPELEEIVCTGASLTGGVSCSFIEAVTHADTKPEALELTHPSLQELTAHRARGCDHTNNG